MKKFFKPVIFGVLCLILSIVVTIQLRVTSTSGSKSSMQRRTDKLKDQIFSLNDQNSKMQLELQQSTEKLDKARTRASQNDENNLEKSNLISRYNTFLGNTDVYGSGVIVTYNPKKGDDVFDTAQILRSIVNELKNVGVEAISINRHRVVPTTAIESVKNKIEVNGSQINSPYIIIAIGDSSMIENSIGRPGGIVDVINASGSSIKVEQMEKIEINKYNDI